MSLGNSGIRSVGFFTATPVHTCDRCGAGIKYVAAVTFKDGTRAEFGSECIDKVLSGDNSLRTLWKRNEKLLRKYQRWLEILSLPEDQIPVDERGYYDRGLFFIADDSGKAMCPLGKSGHCAFHPTKVDFGKSTLGEPGKTFDMRDCGLSAWEPFTYENWQKKSRHAMEQDKAWLRGEIERISAFLAQVLDKASTKQISVKLDGMARVVKVTITKNDAEEVLHKMGILHDTPDLLDEYSLTEAQAEALLESVPRKGGEWQIPAWAEKAVKEEMADHVIVLRDIANDARDGGEPGQALCTAKLAKRLEKIFGLEEEL